MQATQPLAYQIEVPLKHSKPPIWRRLLVADDTTLEELHSLLQVAMGWEGDHLHRFVVSDHSYGPRRGYTRIEGVEDESRARLRQVAPVERSRFLHEYDLGDGWEHDILVEKTVPRDPNRPLPACLKGARACPPEDIGGIWGYEAFLEAFHDPNHPEHDTYADWVDESFDREEFDAEAATAGLRRMALAHQPRRR